MYSVLLAVPTFSVVAWGLWRSGGTSDSAWILAAWLGFVLVGDLLLVPIWGEVEFSFSLPALLAAGMVFEPPVAAALGAIGFVDLTAWRPKPEFDRALVNRAQIALSAGAASLVFHSLGGDLASWPAVLIPATLALAVDCALNGLLVVIGVSLLRGTSVAASTRNLYLGPKTSFLGSYGCFGALGLLIATAYTHIGVWALFLGLAPMFLAAQMLNRWRELLRTADALEEKSTLLRASSEQAVLEREDERKRIASAIHDDVLQSLHYLMLHAQVIREDLRHGRLLQLEEDVPVLLKSSQRTAELARAVVSGLRQSPVGRGGVGPTLQLLADELAQEFDGSINTQIEPITGSAMTEMYVYQVGREALTNAVRHSGGSAVRLELTQLGSEVHLRVADNGKGFDLSAGPPAGHFGLSLMKERVASGGGTLSIRSTSGEGTDVEVLFPASNEAGVSWPDPPPRLKRDNC